MKKTLLFLLVCLCLWGTANAVPAKPGLKTVTQSDGTTLQVQALGDEFHHSLATADFLTIDQGSDGDFYYVSAQGLTNVRAHDAATRTVDETAFLQAHQGEFTMAALLQARQQSGMLRARRAASKPKRATQVPTMGTPRVPIILVQYTDKKMSNTKAQIEAHYKTEAKSVYQYFVDQSNGKYTPQFDLYGVYTLPNNRATYGANSGGLDKGVALMVNDGIIKAGDDIDWSIYDNDNDGEVDVCIVVYAGVGEAQASSVRNAVWPCQWSFSDAISYNDGYGPITRNDVVIDKFAVFNEVGGGSDSGTTLDGIGTFCHEFSHCLGLPDFYETTYRYGYPGMLAWSLMNSGCYNGIYVDGDTPIGYSAYEKNFMNWIDLIEPVANTQYTLPVFNSKSLETDQAIKITSPLNENEFFILENRRQQGWDYCIDDEGVLITHFTYIQSRWDENSVNDQSIQLATFMPADNTRGQYNLSADLYGESNHQFTDNSTPAAKLNMKANGSLASSTGGAGNLGKPVTEIYLNNDGTASLWFMKGFITKDIPQFTEVTDVTNTSFTAHWSAVNNAKSYTLQVWDNAMEPSELLINENFPGCTKEDYYDVSSTINSLCDVAGWTGSNVFSSKSGLRVGSNVSTGSLTSPELSLQGSDKVTVKVTAHAYKTDTDVNFTVACGGQEQSFTASSSEDMNFEILFENVEDESEVSFSTLQANKRLVLSHVEIYYGNTTASSPQITDNQMRVIEGLTTNYCNVNNLNAGTLYNMIVRAIYTDDTIGEWSDEWQVQLPGGSTVLPGDVNNDGIVDVQDVSATIAYILNQPIESFNVEAADIDGSGTIDVQDVSAIINIILNLTE